MESVVGNELVDEERNLSLQATTEDSNYVLVDDLGEEHHLVDELIYLRGVYAAGFFDGDCAVCVRENAFVDGPVASTAEDTAVAIVIGGAFELLGRVNAGGFGEAVLSGKLLLEKKAAIFLEKLLLQTYELSFLLNPEEVGAGKEEEEEAQTDSCLLFDLSLFLHNRSTNAR